MRWMIGSCLVAAVLALSGLSTAGAVERATGCFPGQIGDLRWIDNSKDRQDAIRQYRNTQVAGYNADPYMTAVTVFVYDKTPVMELQEEFRASSAEVLAAHEGAESARTGPFQLEVQEKLLDGFLGFYLWGEGEADIGSFLWVGELPGKYVKIRTTYVRPESDAELVPAMAHAVDAMRGVAAHVCDLGETDLASQSKGGE